ncbi:MAG: phosphoribosylanthranilate isomerase [Alphaproteobacteria bacterium]
MPVKVKICGINDPQSLTAAIGAGAHYVGLVFHPLSPRAVTLEQAAQLARLAAGRIQIAGLFVDPDDAALQAALRHVPLDWLQLHGSEAPRRVAAIKAATGAKIIKAVKIAAAEDFAAVADYAPLADQLLFDAKPAPGASLPGGNAAAFDWRLLAGRTFPRPWMLAGGLTPDNVAEAVGISGAAQVDVSSGVEDRPGVKNPAKIAAFCAAIG